MKITHFPFSVGSLVAVNLAVWFTAAVAIVVMLLAGALSNGPEQPFGAPVSGAETVEVEVLDSTVVAAPVVVDTQVSSVAIVRAP